MVCREGGKGSAVKPFQIGWLLSRRCILLGHMVVLIWQKRMIKHDASVQKRRHGALRLGMAKFEDVGARQTSVR